jgi:paraquat-inducible protein B
MSKQINRTFIGAFVVGALTLWLLTVLLLSGGQFFKKSRQHVLYFHGEAQGLQVGAPVVFLGVKVGAVKRIQLGLDTQNNTFLVPVTIEVDAQAVLTDSGAHIDLQSPETIRQLVDHGLRAQLKIQSLLTGQLYVNLDFHQDKPANFLAKDPRVSEIPTIPTRVEELTSMLKDFSMSKFLADLSAISESIIQLTSSEEAKNIPIRLEKLLANLESLTAKLDTVANPLLAGAQKNLDELHQTLVSVKNTIARGGNAMERMSEFVKDDSVISQTITKTSHQVEEAALEIRNLSNEDSQTIQRLNSALLEISRLARAMRLLAETLEKQPEAIIKGKRVKAHDYTN